MKKNFTSTLVMLSVLIGLVGWYVLYEEKYRPESKEKEEQTKKLISLDPDQVTEFRLTRLKNPPPENSTTPTLNAEYETIEVKKTGPDWFIISPVQTKGDNSTISSLLSSVCSLKQERTVEEKPKDLTIFGLKDPIFKIALKKDSTSPAQEVWVGSNTPVAYSLYAKTHPSEEVFKTSRTLRSALDKDLFALRDKSLVNLNRNELSEVEIQNSKENIVLSRSGNNLKEEWTLSRENLPADSSEWNKTLTPLIELKASKIASEKAEGLAVFGLNKPIAKITFVKSDKTRTVLLIGKVKTSLFAKLEDGETISEVDKTLEEKITTKASQYRNKHIANFDRFEIKKIKLLRGAETLELTKNDNSNWVFADDLSAKIDSSQVDSFLTKLQDIQLTKYLTEGPKVAMEKANLKVSLYEKSEQGEKEVLNLAFVKNTGNQVKGQKTGLPVQFEMNIDDFNKLNIFKQTLIKTEDKPKEADKLQKKS